MERNGHGGEGGGEERGETDRIARAVFKSQREVAEGHKRGISVWFYQANVLWAAPGS